MVKLSMARNFLKTKDVKTGDVVTFVSEGEWVENTKFKRPDGSPQSQFIIKVEINDVEMDMSLNSTNRKALIQAFGDDTVKWQGKSAKIEMAKMMVSGGMKDVIILTPIVGEDDGWTE